jgi:hypothetical protein
MKPLIIYQGKRQDPEKEIWKGAHYNHSKSGWMNSDVFLDWFINVFIPGANEYRPDGYNGPIFLILDGHISHTTFDVIKTAKDNNVVMIRLPSHSTHILQPLDLCVFGPLKKFWSQILQNFETEHNHKVYIISNKA